MDMDGVLVHEEQAIPGADRFLARLRELGLPFLVLTNNSIYTRATCRRGCAASGIDVPEEAIWTSALATARFLRRPAPGRLGLRHRRGGADHRAARGRLHADRARPRLRRARRDPHLQLRAHHPGDPPDRRRRALHRHQPRSDRTLARRAAARPPGSVAALISRATGVEPYFVGKPNPLMMRSALNALDAHSETTAMIGDRMDTDVVAGLEAGLRDDPRAHRRDHARGGRALPVPAVARWSTRSPTWSTSSAERSDRDVGGDEAGLVGEDHGLHAVARVRACPAAAPRGS